MKTRQPTLFPLTERACPRALQRGSASGLPENGRSRNVNIPAPETGALRQSNRTESGLSLTEVCVVVVVIGLLGVLFLPALAAAKKKSSKICCVQLLKQNGLAFRMWSNDNGARYPMQVSVTNGGSMELALKGDVVRTFQVMSNELSTPKLLICESDTKTYATNFETLTRSNISYFAGIDVTETDPQSILSGDANLMIDDQPVKSGLARVWHSSKVAWSPLTLHKGYGNIGLADGSVFASTGKMLNDCFQSTNQTPIRLAIP